MASLVTSRSMGTKTQCCFESESDDSPQWRRGLHAVRQNLKNGRCERTDGEVLRVQKTVPNMWIIQNSEEAVHHGRSSGPSPMCGMFYPVNQSDPVTSKKVITSSSPTCGSELASQKAQWKKQKPESPWTLLRLVRTRQHQDPDWSGPSYP